MFSKFEKGRTLPGGHNTIAAAPLHFLKASILVASAAVLSVGLGACSPQAGQAPVGEPFVRSTGTSRGPVVPGALPGVQSAPDTASTAGSSLSESSSATVPQTGSARGVRVPNAR